MATFRIHEDVENSDPNKITLVPSKLNEKRSTLAVLNNVQRGTKTHAFKTVIFIFQIFRLRFAHITCKCSDHFLNFAFSFLSIECRCASDKNESVQ